MLIYIGCYHFLDIIIADEGVAGICYPKVYTKLSTHLLLVSELVDGVELSAMEPSELVTTAIPVAQEEFFLRSMRTVFFMQV